MADIEQRLNELVSGFINDIGKLARQVALDTLSGALVGAVAGSTDGNGRTRAARRGGGPGLKRPKGAKRPVDEIEQLMATALDYITGYPGQRIEQINAKLGTKTGDLSLPLKKLIADGAIRTEGDRRATKYFPGDGTPKGNGKKRRRRS